MALKVFRLFNQFQYFNPESEELKMEFGLRPRDRPGTGKAPSFATGLGAISAREHRKIGRSSVWISDYGSLTLAELEEKYPTGN